MDRVVHSVHTDLINGREADQRAKERYDARTNELKAEYDARTADGWGKDRAAQNFRNDADYWRKQQKKY